jgi:plasmid stabilization system protein ParE
VTADPGFHPEARAEFLAEVDYLNGEQPGLGDEFEQALYATADMIGMWPQAGATWPDLATNIEVRSLGIRRFPFRVVYINEGTPFTVIAVAHTSREPGYWKHRVQ